MNSYESETPRTAFAIAAVALTAITLGVFVVMPAALDSGFEPAYVLAAVPPAATPAASAFAGAPTEVAIVPARIEVTGVREPNVAWAMGDPSQPCKPAT